MFKFLLLFMIFLTACSQVEPVIIDVPQVLPDISEHEDHYISNILGPMLIDEIQLGEEYVRIKNIFIQIQLNCHEKWFVEYRQCMIVELDSQRKTAWFSDEIDKKIQLLISSIEDEIKFIPHYLNLDEASMPDNPPGSWNHQDKIPNCNILSWTGVSHPNYMGEPTTTVVLLSYFDDFSRLEEIFPRWNYHKEQYKKNWLESSSIHIDGPCAYWTFGPDTGNIVFFIEKWDFVYLFIKESDGGWSGEFFYSVFVHQKGIYKFTQIGNFQSRSGIIPYYAEFYPGHDVSSKNVREYIIQFYQNRIFLYGSYFQNKYIYGSSVFRDLLDESFR